MQTDLELFEEFLRKNKALTKFKEVLWEKEKYYRAIYPKYLNPALNRKPILKRDVWVKFKETALNEKTNSVYLKYCISGHIPWSNNSIFWRNLSDKWKMFYDFMNFKNCSNEE